MLRKTKVVGKFVEFHGPGVVGLPVPDRATLSNMAPEYGATLGIFPVDEETCSYLNGTGRPGSLVETVRGYYTAQQMFGAKEGNGVEYSAVVELNLDEIEPSVAGPRRPQDRIPLSSLKKDFRNLLQKPLNAGGFGKSADDMDRRFAAPDAISGK